MSLSEECETLNSHSNHLSQQAINVWKTDLQLGLLERGPTYRASNRVVLVDLTQWFTHHGALFRADRILFGLDSGLLLHQP